MSDRHGAEDLDLNLQLWHLQILNKPLLPYLQGGAGKIHP